MIFNDTVRKIMALPLIVVMLLLVSYALISRKLPAKEKLADINGQSTINIKNILAGKISSAEETLRTTGYSNIQRAENLYYRDQGVPNIIVLEATAPNGEIIGIAYNTETKDVYEVQIGNQINKLTSIVEIRQQNGLPEILPLEYVENFDSAKNSDGSPDMTKIYWVSYRLKPEILN